MNARRRIRATEEALRIRENDARGVVVSSADVTPEVRQALRQAAHEGMSKTYGTRDGLSLRSVDF